jgi:hypothetical protein
MDERKKIQELIQQLGIDVRLVRARAVEMLVKIGEPAMIPLIGALEHESWEVRMWSVRALGEMKDERAVMPLICALKDNSWPVRNEAGVLIEMGDTVVMPLICALEDENLNLRGEAAWLLEKLFNKYKKVEEVQKFEDNLIEGLARLKKKCRDKREVKKIKFHVAKWRMKAAEKKNELAGKKDILLPDKPKPPKKGQMFNRLRRVRNG